MQPHNTSQILKTSEPLSGGRVNALSLQGPHELSLDFPNTNAAFHQSKQTCHPSHPFFLSKK